MQIENDYDKEVYNGDIGYIDDVDSNAGETCGSADVVRKLTNSRPAGPGSIASNRASSLRGAAHPVPI